MKNKKLATYKGVDIFYQFSTGKIIFNFENTERVVKYYFEAQEIIDNPVWEKCNLKGFFVDGVLDDFIGLAKAERVNIKNKKPDWKYKGKFGLEFKDGDEKVYQLNKHNASVYQKFEKQRDIVFVENTKLKEIISELK